MASRFWLVFLRLTPLTLAIFLFFLVVGKGNTQEQTQLYQVEVEASLSETEWQRAALTAALIKLTGNGKIQQQPAVVQLLRQSGDFVKQFQMVQRNGSNLLQVQLNSAKIVDFLQKQQIPIWGERRPEVLLWLTEHVLDQPRFVELADHPALQEIAKNQQKFGLNFKFPFFDEQDKALLTPDAVWQGDWTGLSVASPRYQAQEVISVLLSQQVDAAGQLSFHLQAQQWLDGQLQKNDFSDSDLAGVISQFSEVLASTQASKYAVNVPQGSQTGGSVRLTIDQVNRISDVYAVQALFKGMLTVQEVQLIEYQPNQMMIDIKLAVTEAEFYRDLALERRLVPVHASSQPAASELTEQLQTHNTPNHGEIASATDSLVAAEQALEAALSQPEEEVEGDDNQADVGSFIPTMAVTPELAVGHLHFSYVRP